MTDLRVGRSSRAARRPTSQPDDAQHEKSGERLTAILRVAPLQPCRKVTPAVGSKGCLVSKVGANPPKLRPIVAVPTINEEHSARVALQVELAFQPARSLRLDQIDRDRDATGIVDGEDDRHGVRTALRVHGRQHSMHGVRQSCGGFLVAQSHSVILPDTARPEL